mmetsp:Transcript_20696/g.31316  ORF Transcript_20696/g.31316 Transcript_20696/m.31316 type:complete len:414 (-) Transcript_20696:129-1370(-)
MTNKTTHLWNLLDEDNIRWKNLIYVLREILSDDKTRNGSVLHFVVDRNPPPRYMDEILELLSDDLLREEATFIDGNHQFCYPVGISCKLSTDEVFQSVVEATKYHLNSNKRFRGNFNAFLGISVEKIDPNRLKKMMENFPDNQSMRRSLLEVLLCRFENPRSWEACRCILEYHPCAKLVAEIDTDPIVRFFRLFPHLCIDVDVPRAWVIRIPKLLRCLLSKTISRDLKTLHVALNFVYMFEKDVCRTKIDLKSSSEILQVLIQAIPAAATVRNEAGQLPLHVAADRGLPCILPLIQAHPNAVKMRCPITKLFPFQLAAAQRNTDGPLSDGIEMTWTILKETPDLLDLSHCCSEDHSWSTEDKQVAKVNMEIARTARRYHQKILALEKERDQSIEDMKAERESLLESNLKRKRS